MINAPVNLNILITIRYQILLETNPVRTLYNSLVIKYNINYRKYKRMG